MRCKTIVIIAGETSGDQLGAGLMRALLKSDPTLYFEGIGGTEMLALGFRSLVPIERLAVMGMVEVMFRLPELLCLRRYLRKRYSTNKPLVMIGIDSPDFNLSLEASLKEQDIPVLHYVSPSVWAWRETRLFTIAKACHHVLALFPFEVSYYTKHNIPVTCVGHRLADELPGAWQQNQARQQLQLEDTPVLALLPGSRAMEVKQLGRHFILAARNLQMDHPYLQVIIAAANPIRFTQLEALLHELQVPAEAMHLVLNKTRAVLAASDAVLVASGTATLEAMLFAKPMLVCYRLRGLSYWLFKRLLQVPFVSLPNLLAGRKVVDEILQDAVQVATLVQKMQALLFDERTRVAQQQTFSHLYQQLARDADNGAAKVVFQVIAQHNGDVIAGSPQ